jgi:predicted nucleic acid-binding protein
MRNALALGVFRRILTSAQVSTAWSDVERDLRSGRLVPQPVNWRPAYRAAAQWTALHSPRIGCRSLDVLHVSLAKQLNAKEFFTFDERQKSLALVLVLAVKP